MQIDYLSTVSSVLGLLNQPDSPCKDISMYKTCYMSLFRYLLNEGIPFSMDAALEWLQKVQQSLSKETYTQYRGALFRLEHYLLFGNIDTMHNCRSMEFFYCRSGMSESFYRLVYELEDYYAVTQNDCYFPTYSVAIKSFFKHATAQGITEPEAITLDVLISYWNDYCLPLDSLARRQNAVCAMTALMKYLNHRGDVPWCYQYALFNSGVSKLEKMNSLSAVMVFHPSEAVESYMEGFLSLLTDWKYRESSKRFYRTDFCWYFLFLELNHLEHSSEAVALWEECLSNNLDPDTQQGTVSERRKHTIRMFDSYLHGKLHTNLQCKYENGMESLPKWSREILEQFIESRRLDGMTQRTLTMCRTVGCRFFQYLTDRNLIDPESISPDVIKAFQQQDAHSTPESKNAYNIKLRQLLQYMAEQGVVASTLVLAVSTACAPHRNIVDVLSDDIVEKIYAYRDKASSPIELRDTAIVMLGLRMGIRGVDILNLKISDFDWKRQTVSFIQQKTRTAITLPVPTDVGNSVYKYIRHGRPESADVGNGYIFIRHLAPYSPLKVTTACRSALKRILSEYDFTLSAGQGFHMTRKTFATRLLRAENRLDDISNALGHVRHETAEVYLERDEEKMRLCPIGFGGVIS